MSQIHDMRRLIWPSVPFTFADHLVTYCRHREWTRGLMFHEYYYVPPVSCSDLRERISAQDREVVVPTLRGTESELKKLELRNLFSSAKTPPPLGGVRAVLTG